MIRGDGADERMGWLREAGDDATDGGARAVVGVHVRRQRLRTHHGAPGPASTTDPTATAGPDGEPGPPGPSVYGFDGVELREGDGPTLGAAPVTQLDGTPLDPDAIAAVIERLVPFDAGAAASTGFNWPTETITRPQGEQTDVPFPSDEEVDAPPATPETLEVLRIQPTGDVGLAPFLSITFNQPMVPVGTVDQLAAADVPATISPAVEGRWQWIGTSTLRFDAADRDRLPMATDYTITVPAGTRSVSGAELAEAVEVAFATPSAEVQGLTGDDRQDLPLQPVLVATFDQDVDAEAVLAGVTVTADGDGAPRSARHRRRDRRRRAGPGDRRRSGRGSFRGVHPGPAVHPRPAHRGDRRRRRPVRGGPGCVGRRAPLLDADVRPAADHRVRCWQSPCRPGDGVEITFNNELDAGAFEPAGIGIEPAVGARTVTQYGNVVSVQGAWRPNSTYRLSIPAGVTDVYGQSLGAPDTRELEIGPARPLIRPFEDVVVTVDPSAEPAVPVVTVGHEELRVTVWAADPADWADTVSTLYPMSWGEDVGEPDWPVLREETIEVAGDPDVPVETSVDLADLMPDGHGQVIVRIASVREFDEDDEDFWSNLPAVAWVQGTDLGVDVVNDATSQHVWVTDLATGTPLEGVTVGSTTADETATTDANGLAVLALPGGSNDNGYAVTATRDGDVAVLPGYRVVEAGDPAPRCGTSSTTAARTGRARRSGSRAGFAGSRPTASSRPGTGTTSATSPTTATASRSPGARRRSARPAASRWRSTCRPGPAPVRGGSPSTSSQAWGTMHELTIAEFRRPDFEVTTSAGSGPHRRGESIAATAQADYYTGGPLGDAAVTWQVTTSEATYAPPGWDRFDFGRWLPWWFGDVFVDDLVAVRVASRAASSRRGEGGVVHGPHRRRRRPPSRPARRRPRRRPRRAAGHRARQRRRAGRQPPGDCRHDRPARPPRRPLRRSRRHRHLRPPGRGPHDRRDRDRHRRRRRRRARPRLVAGRANERFVDGEWTDELLDTTTCTVTSATEPAPCTLTPPAGGTYRITATVTDDAGRVSRSETTRWVSGAEAVPSRTVGSEALTIVPDAEEYRPGQTAQLLVQAPFATGTGLIVTDRGPVTSTATFEVADGSAIVPVEVGEDDVPNINVSIEVAGTTPRTAADGSRRRRRAERPAFATGTVTLPVSTASRDARRHGDPGRRPARPRRRRPRSTCRSPRPDGAPVAGADLLVMVVDEAVLALSGYELADPARRSTPHLPTEIEALYGRDGIVLVDPAALLGGGGRRRRRRRAPATTAAAAAGQPAGCSSGTTARRPGLAEAPSRRRSRHRAARTSRCAATSTPSRCSPRTSRPTPPATPPSTSRSPTTSPATA